MGKEAERKKVVKHSLILITTTGVIFLWAISPYESFATQIAASLLALFITKHIFREHLNRYQESLIDSVVLTALVLVIVTATGSLASPLFFLIYFLLFILSLLLEPTIPLTLSFALIVYFLFASPINKTADLLSLFSFPLITPLSVYFGKEHKRKIYYQHNTLHLKETIRRETEDVFFWLTTTFSRYLEQVFANLENLPRVSEEQKPYLKKIKDSLLRLKKMADKLKKAIEED